MPPLPGIYTYSGRNRLGEDCDTLSEESAIGRWSQVCDHCVYFSCLCVAVDLAEQQNSKFRYQYSHYQVEYSRNLLFGLGGCAAWRRQPGHSWRAKGFTCAELAHQIARIPNQVPDCYGPRQPAYDLKKLRGSRCWSGSARRGTTRQVRLDSRPLPLSRSSRESYPPLAGRCPTPPALARMTETRPRWTAHYKTAETGMAVVLRELVVAA